MIVLGSSYTSVMQALARKLPDGCTLRPFDPTCSLVDQVEDVDVLIIGSHRVTAEVIKAAPKLKLVHQHGRGVDSVDRIAAASAGVTVANVPGGNGVAVAEMCLTLILIMAKGVKEMLGAIAGRLTGVPVGIEISGKTLALIGLGDTGRELALRANALGMKVIAVRAHPEAGKAIGVDQVHGPAELHNVLRQADFVCLLATLDETTKGLIGDKELSEMKKTAFLINAARGAMVQYDALLTALRSKVIAGAAFDTFWSEPADPADPMLAEPRFFLSPHVAGFSDVSIDYVTNVVAENIARLKAGTTFLNVVPAP